MQHQINKPSHIKDVDHGPGYHAWAGPLARSIPKHWPSPPCRLAWDPINALIG